MKWLWALGGLFFGLFCLVAVALTVPLRCLSCVVDGWRAETHEPYPDVKFQLLGVDWGDVEPIAEEALARLEAKEGGLSVTLLVGASDDFVARYTTFGVTHFSPLGGPVVVLGPKGTNADVMAHELVHAALFHRWGFIKRETAVPTWFDEGFAMQFDLRPGYGLAQACSGDGPPDLASLATPAGFFTADLEASSRHYAFAKLVVADWLAKGLLANDDLGDMELVAKLAKSAVPDLCS